MINLFFKRSTKEAEQSSSDLTKTMAPIKATPKKTITKIKAKAEVKPKKLIITDASPESCFWINNGPVVKNLVELAHAIEEMDDEKFDYHTKRDGNDFVRWVEEILGEKELAVKLSKIKIRKNFAKAIKDLI